MKSENLAVVLEGLFESAFDESPEEEVDETLGSSRHLKKSLLPGKVFVASSSSITTNQVVSEQGGDPGFYPIHGSTTLQAQTAYLQLPTSFVTAGVKVSVVFEEDIITGIEDFRISDEDATIYDLAGRRLGKKKKGINIVNGKKVLVK